MRKSDNKKSETCFDLKIHFETLSDAPSGGNFLNSISKLGRKEGFLFVICLASKQKSKKKPYDVEKNCLKINNKNVW